jgi:2-desacetyl-2-hydroxyethyl bacteriochlorophyllide A dehydrogenase
MNCLRTHEWGSELQLEDIERPTPGVNDVVLSVEATGVGRSVVNVTNGDITDNSDHLPRIPGHEIVGTVVETGNGVESLSEGDYVATYMYLSCDQCGYCRRGQESLCQDLDGLVGAHVDGGYAEYVCLPAANVLTIPEVLDPIEATTIPDAIATPYHVAMEQGAIATGDDVLILGAGGGVGIHMVQVADYFGGSVTAVDIVDSKLKSCAEHGAERTVNVQIKSLSEQLSALTYDVIVDFTGDTALLEEALGLLAPHGRLVNLTTFPDRTMDFAPRDLVFQELQVLGSRYCSKAELLESAALVAEKVVTPVVSETVSLEGVADLQDRIVANEVLGRGAVVP